MAHRYTLQLITYLLIYSAIIFYDCPLSYLAVEARLLIPQNAFRTHRNLSSVMSIPLTISVSQSFQRQLTKVQQVRLLDLESCQPAIQPRYDYLQPPLNKQPKRINSAGKQGHHLSARDTCPDTCMYRE